MRADGEDSADTSCGEFLEVPLKKEVWGIPSPGLFCGATKGAFFVCKVEVSTPSGNISQIRVAFPFPAAIPFHETDTAKIRFL